MAQPSSPPPGGSEGPSETPLRHLRSAETENQKSLPAPGSADRCALKEGRPSSTRKDISLSEKARQHADRFYSDT